MPFTIIGVMGPGNSATDRDINSARELGRLIAKEGCVLLTGGRNTGVMDAALHGAKQEGGLTIGILPGDDDRGISSFVDFPIKTGMGSARNNINVLTSDLVIACGTGPGTVSEIMLALKAGKPVITLNQPHTVKIFLNELAYEKLQHAFTPDEAIQLARNIL